MSDNTLNPMESNPKEITIPKYVFDNMADAIRIAANILESRARKTAADRQIDFAERLANWVKEGKEKPFPTWIPNHFHK